MSGPLLLI